MVFTDIVGAALIDSLTEITIKDKEEIRVNQNIEVEILEEAMVAHPATAHGVQNQVMPMINTGSFKNIGNRRQLRVNNLIMSKL